MGTGKTAKQTSKLSNKLPDKSSSQTLSRQKLVAALCGPQIFAVFAVVEAGF